MTPLLLREILDKTAERVDRDLNDQPEVQGDLWFTLGTTYSDIGDFPRAIAMLQHAVDCYRAALGTENAKLALALGHLGRCQSFNKNVLAGKKNAELGLEMARNCGDSEILATCLQNMSRSFDLWGLSTSQGVPYLRESLELRRQLGNDPVALADCMHWLANSLDDDVEAESLNRESLELHREQLGPDHPKVVNDLFGLGQVLLKRGKFEEAETALRETVDLYRKVYDKNHPYQPVVLRLLAAALVRQGKWSEAEFVVRQAMETNPSITDYRILFGSVKAAQGEWVEAVEQFSRTKTNDWLAIALLQAGRNDEYRRLRHECLERRGTALDTETRLNHAKAFLLLPADGDDSERACNLGDIDAGSVSEKRYVYWLDAVKALAEYRRGHFESASDLANRVISREDDTWTSRQAQAWCIRRVACAIAAHGTGPRRVGQRRRAA